MLGIHHNSSFRTFQQSSTLLVRVSVHMHTSDVHVPAVKLNSGVGKGPPETSSYALFVSTSLSCLLQDFSTTFCMSCYHSFQFFQFFSLYVSTDKTPQESFLDMVMRQVESRFFLFAALSISKMANCLSKSTLQKEKSYVWSHQYIFFINVHECIGGIAAKSVANVTSYNNLAINFIISPKLKFWKRRTQGRAKKRNIKGKCK